MKTSFSFLALASLLGGCVVDGTDDEGAGDTGSASATSAEPTSSSGTTSDGGADESSTSPAAESSGAGESGTSGTSGGLEPDCSQCSEDVDPDPLCHSSFDSVAGQCVCDAGYIFESRDPDDFTCVPQAGGGDCGDDPNIVVGADGSCICAEGFEFCSADPNDLTCCEVG